MECLDLGTSIEALLPRDQVLYNINLTDLLKIMLLKREFLQQHSGVHLFISFPIDIAQFYNLIILFFNF